MLANKMLAVGMLATWMLAFQRRAWTPDRTNGKNFRQEILETRKLQDVISLSSSHANIPMPAFEMFAFIMPAN